MIAMGIIPIYTCIMAGYDGSLVACGVGPVGKRPCASFEEHRHHAGVNDGGIHRGPRGRFSLPAPLAQACGEFLCRFVFRQWLSKQSFKVVNWGDALLTNLS